MLLSMNIKILDVIRNLFVLLKKYLVQELLIIYLKHIDYVKL